MNVNTVRWGGLECRVVDALPPGADPQFVVVLCHGFGAPGTDLVGLAPEIITLHPKMADKVQFIFPAAPLSLDQFGMYGGRAWWMIDLVRFQSAIERGETRELHDEIPEGLPESRAKIMQLLDEVQARTKLPMSRILLGGFSQGAMLTTDVTLRLDESPAGLCIFSGTLLSQTEWQKEASKRAGLQVILSHGRQDPILPFSAAENLRDMLADAGLRVEFMPFNGPHTIPMLAMQRLASMIVELSGQQ